MDVVVIVVIVIVIVIVIVVVVVLKGGCDAAGEDASKEVAGGKEGEKEGGVPVANAAAFARKRNVKCDEGQRAPSVEEVVTGRRRRRRGRRKRRRQTMWRRRRSRDIFE